MDFPEGCFKQKQQGGAPCVDPKKVKFQYDKRHAGLGLPGNRAPSI